MLGQNGELLTFCEWIVFTVSLFIVSSVDSGCFHVLAVANNTAMNRGGADIFGIVIFVTFGYIPTVELPDDMVVIV